MTTEQIEQAYKPKKTRAKRTQKEEKTEVQPEVQAEAPPRTLSEASTEIQQRVVNDIIQHLTQGYLSQDYVREIRVHPEDLELVKSWVAQIDMPPMVRQLLAVGPNDTNMVAPGYVMQSQIETQWLSQYYKQQGLMDMIRRMEAPIILGHKDLKQLFLTQVMDKLQEQKRIIVPGL